MPWFANKGQILQALLATAACFLAGVKTWPEMKANMVSNGAIVFYLLILLVLFSVATLVRSAKSVYLIDPASKRLVMERFGSLNLAERLDLRMYLRNRRESETNIHAYLRSQGFESDPNFIFENLRQKIPVMDADNNGPNGIRPEYIQLVRKLLKPLDIIK